MNWANSRHGIGFDSFQGGYKVLGVRRAAVLIVVLLLPTPAFAHHKYGPDAGFEKARDGESIQVWQPAAWKMNLRRAARGL